MPETPKRWKATRPQVMVIACSDGRYQEQTDEFLASELKIQRYDRLYIPGGPGALCPSGIEYLRADFYRRECAFLIEAHALERLVLLFHCGSDQGPDDAMCADYLRKLPYRATADLRAQQEADARELHGYMRDFHGNVQVHTYRAEVMPDQQVHFVPLMIEDGPETSPTVNQPA